MIIAVEVIRQPISGEYEERIMYSNLGGSSSWAWIKFTREDYTEWVGQFRGIPVGVEMAPGISLVGVLTAEYFYFLDVDSEEIVSTAENDLTRNLTVTPDGRWFVISDYYSISRISRDFISVPIYSDYEMDYIKFMGWKGDLLSIECEGYRYQKIIKLQLDSNSWSINDSKIC